MVKILVVSVAWLSSIGLTWLVANQDSGVSPTIAESSNKHSAPSAQEEGWEIVINLPSTHAGSSSVNEPVSLKNNISSSENPFAAILEAQEQLAEAYAGEQAIYDEIENEITIASLDLVDDSSANTQAEEASESDTDATIEQDLALSCEVYQEELSLLQEQDQFQYTQSEILAQALVSPDLITRSATIGNIIANMTAESAFELLAVFENTPQTYHANNSYKLFLHAWAKLDGRSAMNYLLHVDSAKHVTGDTVWAMSGWGQAAPYEALAYLAEATVPNDVNLYYGLVRGWARANLPQSESYVSSLPEGKFKTKLVGVIAESYFEQMGIETALDWAANTSYDKGLKKNADQAIGSVFNRAVREAPQLTAIWVQKNTGTDMVKDWMMVQIAEELAEQDIDEAIAFVDSIDPKFLQKSLVETLSFEWATSDALAALNWSLSLNSTLQHTAHVTIVERAPSQQFGSIANWLQSQPSSTQTDQVIALFAKRAIHVDQNLAFAQLDYLSESEAKNRLNWELNQLI